MRFRFYIPTIAANNAGGGTMSWPGGLNVGTFGAGFQFLLVGEADTANTALTAVFHHDY